MVVFTWADTNHATFWNHIWSVTLCNKSSPRNKLDYLHHILWKHLNIIFEKYKQKIIKYAVNNKEQFKQIKRKKRWQIKISGDMSRISLNSAFIGETNPGNCLNECALITIDFLSQERNNYYILRMIGKSRLQKNLLVQWSSRRTPCLACSNLDS